MKIRLDHVVKTFDTFRAVRDVSLEIESGELVALLGPSGSGKTTILRMVAGLEFADGGHIYFGDQDATDIPVRDRDLLRLVQLEGLGDRFPAQISGGQRQRVALARALAVDPKVLLLDEPFGALDAAVRRDLRRWLREIHDELGITTLFVTHDQEEALDLADRVVILNQGQVVQQGTPEQVCREPGSAFVTRFLGDTNRISAEVRGGVAYADGAAIAADGVANGAAEVYARPGDLAWSETGPGIAASVTRVLDRPGGRRVIAITTTGEHLEFDVEPELAVRAGQQGYVTLRRAQVFAAG